MMLLKGKNLGVATAERGKGDNKWSVTVVGIAEQKNDLFHTEVVTQIQLSKEQQNDGTMTKLQELKGKEVTLEIWQKHNAKGDRVFTNTNLIGIV